MKQQQQNPHKLPLFANSVTVPYFPLPWMDCEGGSRPVTASRKGKGLPCHNSIAGLCSACRSSCLFCFSGVPTAWPLLLLWGAWIHHRWRSSRSGAHVSGPAATATGTATAWLHSPYLRREGPRQCRCQVWGGRGLRVGTSAPPSAPSEPNQKLLSFPSQQATLNQVPSGCIFVKSHNSEIQGSPVTFVFATHIPAGNGVALRIMWKND